jgi:hypothetical protein
MNYEREGLLLPETNQPPIDSELFDSFQRARGNFTTYRQLEPSAETKARAIDAWRAGEDADLTVGHLEETELFARQESLKAWKRELLDNDTVDAGVKQLYRWKVNEDIANVNMLIASSRGDMVSFRRWNEFIYGKPNEDIYGGALDTVAHDADELLKVEGQNLAVIASAQNVLTLINGKRGDRELLAPDATTFESVRVDHMRPAGFYGLVLAGVTIPEGKITREVGEPILKHIIKNNLHSSYGLTDASGSVWSLNHEKEAVEQPVEYNLPRERFIGLPIGHEIARHLLEKVNGERGPLALASIGLDRYESGNEGRAVMAEQVPYETFDEFAKLVRWRDIVRRHIAISYAAGVGEESPHRSSEVFTLMNAIDTMYQTRLTPDDAEATRVKAEKKTTDLLLRVLKGTDGKGGAYLKDEVYLEGHVANWLTAATRGVGAISDGDLGKFDINNPRHIAALQKIGLLPDNG